VIADPEVRQVNITKSLAIAKKHLDWMHPRVLHSLYGIKDDEGYRQRLSRAFNEIGDYINNRLLLEETLPPLEDKPEPGRKYFVCEHGHKHRSKRSLQWCNINTEFNAKQQVWLETQPTPEGSTEEVMDFGEFRVLFWSQIAMLIMQRDSFKCQFDGCEDTGGLEVHHIIPRRAGGSDDPKNLITFCHKHHVMQGTHGSGSVRGLNDTNLNMWGTHDDTNDQTEAGAGV